MVESGVFDLLISHTSKSMVGLAPGAMYLRLDFLWQICKLSRVGWECQLSGS